MSKHKQIQPAPSSSQLERQLTALTDRVNALCLQLETHETEKFAYTIEEASRALGMSKSQFRRVFISGGRLFVYPAGERARIIDKREMTEAFERFKADMRSLEARARAVAEPPYS